MATVVRGARATNSGMNSNRLKVDMGNLYELEDSQGALYVTGNVLGGGRAKSYEVRWQTDELRPKFDAVNNGGGYSGSSVLSQCRITSVDGLKGSNPPPNTTVFLTLSCPNSNN